MEDVSLPLSALIGIYIGIYIGNPFYIDISWTEFSISHTLNKLPDSPQLDNPSPLANRVCVDRRGFPGPQKH